MPGLVDRDTVVYQMEDTLIDSCPLGLVSLKRKAVHPFLSSIFYSLHIAGPYELHTQLPYGPAVPLPGTHISVESRVSNVSGHQGSLRALHSRLQVGASQVTLGSQTGQIVYTQGIPGEAGAGGPDF